MKIKNHILYYLYLVIILSIAGCEKGCDKKKVPTEPENKFYTIFAK